MGRTPADSDVFSAIADPARRRILDVLAAGQRPVKDLLPLFRISQPAISQHLRVLREVGLVKEERSGRERIYSVAPQRLMEVADWVLQYEQFWQSRLERLGSHLDRKSAARKRISKHKSGRS